MAGVFARGTMKPPLGAQINPAHPLGKDLLIAIPFHEGIGGGFAKHLPSILRGNGVVAGAPPPPTRIYAGQTYPWSSNREGSCISFTTSDSYTISAGGDGGDWLPQTQATVCMIRRKQDSTNRNAVHFGFFNNEGLNTYCPAADGTIYWRFGGDSGAHSLTAAGLAFSITMPERFVFTAGPRGSTIWQNGVKVASQATAITRTPGSGSGYNWYLNFGNVTNGDNVDVNYLAVYDTQWSDDLCRWWSAEPYAHLYPQTMRSLAFVGLAGASGGTTTPLGGLSILGVG
jgi:hypothetical protein